ncbi:hypothetical protein K493DRAFT_301887 [Basidiobolus meristosporus CBS 931.73]|uniref:Trafficking protein particle complex subunit 10 n=1 Tax=Basidiobolus meristosporus CBS 931.73 TaxID=1314790 RepID=A0A1Y1Y9P1_9FUNG|nr:hypothetical protein K493DRAFT_301887 [Basidiobolus meristosporus CBS 931.73]|eukprot:ORX94739.1 hypothetical protein K493DRAFT_301887 [Basidiobolus meristosporus CBS 931.73]
MNVNRVTVTYCDLYNIWPLIQEELRSYLPLKSLNWKPGSDVNHIIDSLPIDLVEYNPSTAGAPTNVPVRLSQEPYLNLFFVNCEVGPILFGCASSSDLEQYRQSVKKQIKDWHSVVSAKKDQEWLIVYVAGHELTRNTFLNIKGTVYDRIRADFNTKKDRCSILRPHDHEAKNELWQDFMTKVKDGIITSFEYHVAQYEEHIRRMDAQRQMPGWNYCTFFLMKESLAQSYEMMNLFDQALKQYDELEASFFQVLKGRRLSLCLEANNKALTWFKNFGGLDPGDDSADILDMNRKSYRDAILQNDISVFDFRIYLFARQCRLLFLIGDPTEVCDRALKFISTFVRTIRDFQSSFSTNFLEIWTFSSCMNVVETCEKAHVSSRRDSGFHSHYAAVKAELLDKLGIYYGYLPCSPPFIMSLESNTSEQQQEIDSSLAEHPKAMHNEALRNAIGDAQAFYDLYHELSNRAIKYYDLSGHTRYIDQLQGDIASLHLLLIHLSKLLDALNHAYQTLEISRNVEPLFEVTVLSKKDSATELAIEMLVNNSLPIEFTASKLSLKLAGDITNEIEFYCENQLLKPGSNMCRLICETSAPGNYVLDNIRMNVGKLVFTHYLLRETKKRTFRINEHPSTIKIQASLPKIVHIGGQDTILVQILTRQDSIENGVIRVKSLTDLLTLKPCDNTTGKILYRQETFLESTPQEDESTVTLDRVGEDYKLPSLPEQSLLRFTYQSWQGWDSSPLRLNIQSALTQAPTLQIGIVVEYTTKKGQNRTYSTTQEVDLSIPLTWSHKVYFQENCAFFKVHLECRSTAPIRIQTTSLNTTAEFELAQASKLNQLNTLLFPRQDMTVLYKLKRGAGWFGIPWKVSLYRSPNNHHFATLEIESTIIRRLHDLLKKEQLVQHASFLIPYMKQHIRQKVDLFSYGMTNTVTLGEFDSTSLEKLLMHDEESTAKTLLETMGQFFEMYQTIDMEEIEPDLGPYQQTLNIPMSAPVYELLCQVQLHHLEEGVVNIGSACPFKMVLKLADYWKPRQDRLPVELQYDIGIDGEQWLLSGRKRAHFTLDMDSTMEIHFMLVPLKTGFLPYPSVEITSDSLEQVGMCYVNGGKQLFVVPKENTTTIFLENPRPIINNIWRRESLDADISMYGSDSDSASDDSD